MDELRHTFRPLRGKPLHTLLEGAAGFVACQLLALLVDPFHRPPQDVPALILMGLGWIWIVVWPALRLERYRSASRWRWLVFGAGRAVLFALALGCLSVILDGVLQVIMGGPHAFHSLGNAIPGVLFLFLLVRTAVLILDAVRHHIRRRLRRQLMVSHAMTVILTFVTLTAIGSVVALALFLEGTSPFPATMARSARDVVALSQSRSSLDVRRAQETMDHIARGRFALRGEPPLSSLIQRNVPISLLLVRPDGHVLARAMSPGVPRNDIYATSSFPVTGIGGSLAPVWPKVRAEALHVGSGQVELTLGVGAQATPATLAGAPLTIRGRVAAIVLVVAPRRAVSISRNFVAGIVAFFSAATVVVIIATALPVLALSFLLSYFVARRLTGNLEAVSAVATSIVSGDLSARAPEREENEIGTLAGDINRMAAHLETAMGELEAARRKAEEALRSRQALVANISHELRTPLAVIRAHLETLLERHAVAPGASTREEIVLPAATLRALDGETERLGALIDDLFALSRTATGGLEVRREPLDVEALANEVAAVMRPLAQQEGAIALSVHAPPGLPAALGDPDRLRQILANLIRNAIRHTPDGGIIAIDVAAEDRWVVLTVADTGEGIPPDHLPHIFDRFYRVDEARNRESGGAGLGLAIVREFVELMGGTVTVESAEGEGTSFRVFLQRTT